MDINTDTYMLIISGGGGAAMGSIDGYVFTTVLSFKVENFDPLFSDIHSRLTLELHSTVFTNRSEINDDNSIINENI